MSMQTLFPPRKHRLPLSTRMGFADCFRIDDGVRQARLEAGVLKVCCGDLQGVEHQAGGFALDLAGGEQAHDLGEGDLDGIGVLKDGQVVGSVAAIAGAVGVEFEALFALAHGGSRMGSGGRRANRNSFHRP